MARGAHQGDVNGPLAQRVLHGIGIHHAEVKLNVRLSFTESVELAGERRTGRGRRHPDAQRAAFPQRGLSNLLQQLLDARHHGPGVALHDMACGRQPYRAGCAVEQLGTYAFLKSLNQLTERRLAHEHPRSRASEVQFFSSCQESLEELRVQPDYVVHRLNRELNKS